MSGRRSMHGCCIQRPRFEGPPVVLLLQNKPVHLVLPAARCSRQARVAERLAFVLLSQNKPVYVVLPA
jgi:hypothetical protein